MLSFIKGLFGSKKPTSAIELQPHPLDITKYTPPTEPVQTQEQVDKVLATKEWPFPTSTSPATPESVPVTEPAPVTEQKLRKPRAKKEVSAIPVPKPTTKPRVKK